MEELKARVMEIVNKVNQNWVEQNNKVLRFLRDATDKGIDMDIHELITKMAEGINQVAGEYSGNLMDLDEKFRECKERKGKKKGGFFG